MLFRSQQPRCAGNRTARQSFAALLVSLCLLFSSVSTEAGAKLVLVAGGPQAREGIAATESQLKAPFGIEFDSAGLAYLIELEGHRVLKIDAEGKLIRVAGTGGKGASGDRGPGLRASFNGMHNLAIGEDGRLFLADTWNQKVREYHPTSNVVETLAGTGVKGYTGDNGPAKVATFGGIYCVTLSPDKKRLLLADLDNRRIREIELASGIVRLKAGNGGKGIPEDGAQAVAAPLVDPRAVTEDTQGNVWILERGGHALRVVNPAGEIRTVVGNGQAGLMGEDGPGLSAQLNGPKHLCVDRDGTIIIADTENHVIRRYDPVADHITRIAGTGKKGSRGVGGPPEQVELFQPHGVTIGPDGTLYIVDSGNNRVLKLVSE